MGGGGRGSEEAPGPQTRFLSASWKCPRRPVEGTGVGTGSGCIMGEILSVCPPVWGALWLPPLPQGWLPLSLPSPVQARRHRGKRWQGWGGTPGRAGAARGPSGDVGAGVYKAGCPRRLLGLTVTWCPAPKTRLPAGGGRSPTRPTACPPPGAGAQGLRVIAMPQWSGQGAQTRGPDSR